LDVRYDKEKITLNFCFTPTLRQTMCKFTSHQHPANFFNPTQLLTQLHLKLHTSALNA